MEIMNIHEEIVDGIVYETVAYADGHVERRKKAGQENVLSTSERETLDMQTNIQYLVELAEISMEV